MVGLSSVRRQPSAKKIALAEEQYRQLLEQEQA
jgi:hypothetical protein